MSPGGQQLFVTGLADSMTGDTDAVTISDYTH